MTKGVGLGLRAQHYGEVLATLPPVPFFEVVSENYLGLREGGGGRPLEILERVRSHYPVLLHGVSMNLGSADPLDRRYLRRLRALADRVQPLWVSDHLCWTGVAAARSWRSATISAANWETDPPRTLPHPCR